MYICGIYVDILYIYTYGTPCLTQAICKFPASPAANHHPNIHVFVRTTMLYVFFSKYIGNTRLYNDDSIIQLYNNLFAINKHDGGHYIYINRHCFVFPT